MSAWTTAKSCRPLFHTQSYDQALPKHIVHAEWAHQVALTCWLPRPSGISSNSTICQQHFEGIWTLVFIRIKMYLHIERQYFVLYKAHWCHFMFMVYTLKSASECLALPSKAWFALRASLKCRRMRTSSKTKPSTFGNSQSTKLQNNHTHECSSKHGFRICLLQCSTLLQTRTKDNLFLGLRWEQREVRIAAKEREEVCSQGSGSFLLPLSSNSFLNHAVIHVLLLFVPFPFLFSFLPCSYPYVT